MVLHQYQYLLWYCTFAVHTPPSSYTFSVTAGFITAMNISQTFKELHNCNKQQQSWGFFTLAKSSQLRRICNNFRSQLSIFGGDTWWRERFCQQQEFWSDQRPTLRHFLKSRALRIAQSKTAVSEQRCDSKDVNNCIELRSTGESAFWYSMIIFCTHLWAGPRQGWLHCQAQTMSGT